MLSHGNQVEMLFQGTILIGRWKHKCHRLLGRLLLKNFGGLSVRVLIMVE